GMCGIIGFITGSLTFSAYAQSIAKGINGMSGLIIIAIVLRGLTGIAKEYGGIDWLVGSLEKRIHSRKGAEYGISALVALVDCSMANNTVAILVSAP
ncbi:Na+/H+ antiporter NhaC family protein, partial [Salmonella enterica subsp. enterica serovar Typhimurium]|nr:Na+/H+ antiporter NhaC family protein [Salmonella enterica subsp. enterica serovar Typhimurium]